MIKLTEDKKRLLSNFFSLSALQGVNMILPLLTLPYLVRVLGVENFGLINFALSIIMFFSILVSFGFSLSATREISINRDNHQKVNNIFSSVIIIQIILTLLSLFILSILILSVDIFSQNSLLYYTTFGIVFGKLLFPTWFFQGMEKMKYITYINVFFRVIFTALIFVFVKDENDYIYVPILNSLGAILGGLYSLYLIHKLFKVKVIIPNIDIIKKQFIDSYHFFLSRIANNGSRYYATAIIGIYFGNVAVGYYSMVEKLFFAFMSLGGIVSQTIYPYMSRTQDLKFFKKIFVAITLLSIIILIPLLYFNEEFLLLIFNVKNIMLSDIFIIVFSGSIFGIMSSLVGYPLLAGFGYTKYANNSLIYASFIYLVAISISSLIFKDIYMVAFSIVIYQFVGLSFRGYFIHKEKILTNEK
jgi:PST family polysaccharide transporter